MVGCPLSASGAFEDVVLTWAIAEAARVNILTTAKKRQEQNDLVFWGRMTVNARVRFDGAWIESTTGQS